LQLTLRLLMLLFVSLVTVMSSVTVFASESTESCERLIQQFDETRQRIAKTRNRVEALHALLNGTVENSADVTTLFGYRLDDALRVESEINHLHDKSERVSDNRHTFELTEDCAQYEQTAQRLWQERQQLLSEADALTLRLLQKSGRVRTVLQQQLDFFAALDDIEQRLPSASTSAVSSSALASTNFPENSPQLKALILVERASLARWLQLAIAEEAASLDRVNQFWLERVSKSPSEVVTEGPPSLLDRLRVLDRKITLAISAWRNRAFMEAGWLAFAATLDEPGLFVSSVFHETTILPALLWHRISQPFISDYQRAIAEDYLPGLLTSWILQFISLLVILKLLIRAAAHATAWLAGMQQKMLGKLESFKGHTMISGLFWMLKPNASWLFILLVAQISQLVFAGDWHILNLLAPVATLYAVFRALRIIIEWGFSRTYTRSGLFLSNHTSEQLVLDSRRMTWIVLYLILIWAIAYAGAGGTLLYIVSVLAIMVLFAVLWWLMLKHAAAVNKLTQQVLGLKMEVAAGERGWLLRLLGKLAWPLIFMLVQALDIVSSLNQKLMVFDVYRSFSVKLLRVRLDTRADDKEDEDEGAEPDQNYSDWMLRDAPDNLLFDVGDVTGLLTPLKHWYSEKTDENLMVVIGESGSGKSTLIRRLPGMWTESPVKVLDVQPKTTEPKTLFEQIADTLGIERFTDVAGLVRQDGEIEPQVLVIDSAHNLFLAEVGCLKAYKALLECMNAHLQNVFWLVVMHSPSWNYLNCVFSREQRISHVYKMPRWSPMDIRKLILSRHQGGRRRLKYNEMLLSAAASSESSSVRAADSRVFNILWEQCGGNPLAAIELWLNAVKVKGRIAEVGVPQRPPSNLLNGLKDDLFFVYTAIVVHSELSTAEIMRVTHFSEPVVRHALKQGINLGMIVRDESKRYRIDPYWYGTLSGYLHRKNMLWD
jgi:hypothetical protein